jgi:3D (Asp-Asp-Asp) domain-containing protein
VSRALSTRARVIRIGIYCALLVAGTAGSVIFAAARVADVKPRPVALEPVVVTSPIHLPGALVLGASAKWYLAASGPVRYGDPVPVVLTAYCLSGTTRRGRYVRSGIVAADPKYFPLSRFIEVYVGDQYLGRFLVDDTGSRIRGPRLDVWMATCREARLFGRVKGTAVLVPRPEVAVVQAGTEHK